MTTDYASLFKEICTVRLKQIADSKLKTANAVKIISRGSSMLDPDSAAADGLAPLANKLVASATGKPWFIKAASDADALLKEMISTGAGAASQIGTEADQLESEIRNRVVATTGAFMSPDDQNKLVSNLSALNGLSRKQIVEKIDSLSGTLAETASAASTVLTGALAVTQEQTTATDYFKQLKDNIPYARKTLDELSTLATPLQYKLKQGKDVIGTAQYQKYMDKAEQAVAILQMPGGPELIADQLSSEVTARIPDILSSIADIKTDYTALSGHVDQAKELDPGNYQAKMPTQLKKFIVSAQEALTSMSSPAIKDLPTMAGERNKVLAKLTLADGWLASQSSAKGILEGDTDHLLTPETLALKNDFLAAQIALTEQSSDIFSGTDAATKLFQKQTSTALRYAEKALVGKATSKIPGMESLLAALPAGIGGVLGQLDIMKQLLNSFDPPITADTNTYVKLLGKIMPGALDMNLPGSLLALTRVHQSAAGVTEAGALLEKVRAAYSDLKTKITNEDSANFQKVITQMEGKRERELRAASDFSAIDRSRDVKGLQLKEKKLESESYLARLVGAIIIT